MCARLHALTTCLLTFVNFRLRDIHTHVLRYNGFVGKVRGQGLAQDHGLEPDHGLVHEISGCLFKSVIFFIKATKAAGQSRLSKFEAVECSKIEHLWPYQLTLPAVYQLTLHG